MDVEAEEEVDDAEEEDRSQDREAHFVRACPVEMHRHKSQEPFSGFYRKSAVRQSRDTCFVRACAAETHMDISQEPFCMEIYRNNAGRQSLGHCFVQVCTVEMHMDISQVWTFTGKMPNAPATTSMEHRALTLAVRTPQRGHTVCGKT